MPKQKKAASIPTFVLIIILVLLVDGVVLAAAHLRTSANQNAGWKKYSNSVYSINYPEALKLKIGKTESGPLFKENDVYLKTEGFDGDMTNGTIKNGYGVIVTSNLGKYTFDDFDNCTKDRNWVKNSGSCLLAWAPIASLDYSNGRVIKSEETINSRPAIKFEFLSNNEKNNAVGVIINTADRSYVVAVYYKDDKNMKLFNEIINSFKLTQ